MHRFGVCEWFGEDPIVFSQHAWAHRFRKVLGFRDYICTFDSVAGDVYAWQLEDPLRWHQSCC